MKVLLLSPLFLFPLAAQTVTSIEFAPTGAMSTGPVGQSVRIQGTGFDSVASVAFNDVPISNAAIGPSSITANLSPDFHRGPLTSIAAGQLMLRLSRTSGAAFNAIYSFTPAPNVQSVERRSIAGVSFVAVTGSGFIAGLTRLTTYCAGGRPFEAQFSFENSSLLFLGRSECTAGNFLVAAGTPIGATSNGARITGTNYSATFAVGPLDQPLAVTSARVDPYPTSQQGPATHQIKVFGTGFNTNTRVFLNGVMLDPSQVDGAPFTEAVGALLPPGSTGAQVLAQGGQFTVRVGNGTSPSTDAIPFIFPPAPVLAGDAVGTAPGEYSVNGLNLNDSYVVVDCGSTFFNPAVTMLSRTPARLQFRLSRNPPCGNNATPRLSVWRDIQNSSRLNGYGIISSNIVGMGSPVAAPSVTPARIDVTTTSLRADRTVTVNLSVNATSAGRRFEIVSTAAWLTASPQVGSTPETVAVRVNPTTLGPGVQRAELRITIEGTGGAVTVVPVTATITPRPTYQSGVQNVVFWRQGEPWPEDLFLGLTPTASDTRLRVAIRQEGGRDWISSDVTTGETPYVARLRITPGHLEPRAHSARFVLSVADDPGLTREESVTLHVLAPKLRARPESVRLTARRGGADFTHLLEIAGPAEGPRYEISVAPETKWLQLDRQQGRAPETLALRVSPGNLAPGAYQTEVTLQASPPVVIPVELWVSAVTPVKLSATKVSVVHVHGTEPEAQVVQVDSGGSDWTVTTRPASSESWLEARRLGAILELRFRQVSRPSYAEVEVRNAEGGTASLSVDYAANQPVFETVRQDALFVMDEDGVEQRVLSRPGWNPFGLPTSVLAATDDGGAWLSVTGEATAAQAPAASALSVQVRATGMRPGVYRGTVMYAMGVFRMQSVRVTMLVRSRSPVAGVVCRQSAGPLVAVLQPSEQVGYWITAPVYLPSRIQMRARIVDPCGEPVTRNSGVARTVYLLNDSDNVAAQMVDLGNGIWSANIYAEAGLSLTVSARVLLPSGVLQTTEYAPARWISTVTTFSDPEPVPTAVLGPTFGSKAERLSPGMLATIYGRKLTPVPVEPRPSGSPLEETLNKTRVLVDGRPMRLQVAFESQINFLLPNDLPLNRISQLVVEKNGQPSAPVEFMVSSANPGVYQGFFGNVPAVLISGTNSFAANVPASVGISARPVRRGEYLVIYANGLGAVSNAPPYGGLAGVPLSHAAAKVTVTIGGVDAPVTFAGLAPGFIGLYQVNAHVPAAAPSGDRVTLVVRADDAEAAPVQIAVE